MKLILGRLQSARSLIALALAGALTPCVVDAQSESARIYVRRIEFGGVTRVNDTVLRRELLLLEGTYLNTVALEQSRYRLEQLPYVASAQVSLERLDGAPDQVDIVFNIVEAPARRYGGGGGYTKSQRVNLNGFFVNENIFGTGQQFSATMDVSEFRTIAELSHTDPYVRFEGVSRTISLSSRKVDRLTADTTEFDADLATAEVEFGYRTGANHAVRFGLAVHNVELKTGTLASDQLLNWVRNNGDPSAQGTALATDFQIAEFTLRWREDRRNRTIFPDRGRDQTLTFRSAVPGSEVEYYSIDFELTNYWPLNGRWTASYKTKLGYGAKYGSRTTALPPYLNWFSGGPNSVRGYREDRLGPQDTLGNPYGGNLFVAGQFELMMPWPEKWQGRTRFGFFYDIGNAFSTENVNFVDDASENLDYGFKFSRLRQSAGITAQVLIPIGIVRLSYGVPLDAENDHPNRFLRDDIDRFQISIGVDF